MIIKISHKTNYHFAEKVPRLIQSLRLYPTNCKNQKVLDWKIASSKGSMINSFQDALGHKIINIYNKNLIGSQCIEAVGMVKTKDCFGTFSGLSEKVNPICFLRQTGLTLPGKKIIEMSKKIKKKKNIVKFCHELNLFVSELIKYKSNSTTNNTTAEMALKNGEGVCQDFAHILLSMARLFELPARYINGYLIEDENAKDYYTHAWVEIFIRDLGWVAFDPSHKVCVHDKYVRVNCGFDFVDASPIKGVKLNYLGSEQLSYQVEINIGQ